MYRNRDNRLSVVNGQRISHGHTVRDDAKRLRLVGILNKSKTVVKSTAAAAPVDRTTEKKNKACLKKLGLGKYNISPNATKAANDIARARKDALKLVGHEDGNDAIMLKRKRSFDTLNGNNDNNKNNNNNNNMHSMKETTIHLEAKRRKIELKQYIATVGHTDVYACSEVKSPEGRLKLRFTKVSSGTGGDNQSSRKRKQQC